MLVSSSTHGVASLYHDDEQEERLNARDALSLSLSTSTYPDHKFR